MNAQDQLTDLPFFSHAQAIIRLYSVPSDAFNGEEEGQEEDGEEQDEEAKSGDEQ